MESPHLVPASYVWATHSRATRTPDDPAGATRATRTSGIHNPIARRISDEPGSRSSGDGALEQRQGLKVQDIVKQVAVRREDRVRIVKVEPSRES